MLPNRVLKQYEMARGTFKNTVILIWKPLSKHRLLHFQILGCRFKREPENSTSRYTKWANSLTHDQLNLQIFTSNGPTVIMPTWFCHRGVFERFVGGRKLDYNLVPIYFVGILLIAIKF